VCVCAWLCSALGRLPLWQVGQTTVCTAFCLNDGLMLTHARASIHQKGEGKQSFVQPALPTVHLTFCLVRSVLFAPRTCAAAGAQVADEEIQVGWFQGKHLPYRDCKGESSRSAGGRSILEDRPSLWARDPQESRRVGSEFVILFLESSCFAGRHTRPFSGRRLATLSTDSFNYNTLHGAWHPHRLLHSACLTRRMVPHACHTHTHTHERHSTPAYAPTHIIWPHTHATPRHTQPSARLSSLPHT
jgi:hypothetical protein